MIPSGVVVAHEVLFFVILEAQIVLAKIADMNFVHVKIVELFAGQIVRNLLVISRAVCLEIGHRTIGIEQDDQQLFLVLRGKGPGFVQNEPGRTQGVAIQ